MQAYTTLAACQHMRADLHIALASLCMQTYMNPATRQHMHARRRDPAWPACTSSLTTGPANLCRLAKGSSMSASSRPWLLDLDAARPAAAAAASDATGAFAMKGSSEEGCAPASAAPPAWAAVGKGMRGRV